MGSLFILVKTRQYCKENGTNPVKLHALSDCPLSRVMIKIKTHVLASMPYILMWICPRLPPILVTAMAIDRNARHDGRCFKDL